jgi:polyhydroxyalkanoate synthesis regulator phasin
MQLTDLLQLAEATLDRLSPARAQELARQVSSGEGREGVTRLAQDLVDWSQRNRDRMRELVRREVASQLSALGVATKADVEALELRIRRLEQSTGATKGRARSTGTTKRTGSTAGKRGGGTSMSKSTARKPTGGKTAASPTGRKGEEAPRSPSSDQGPPAGGEATGA